MISPQIVLLIIFAIFGVIAGLAQMHEDRPCPYCNAILTRAISRCPHCLCRLD